MHLLPFGKYKITYLHLLVKCKCKRKSRFFANRAAIHYKGRKKMLHPPPIRPNPGSAHAAPVEPAADRQKFLFSMLSCGSLSFRLVYGYSIRHIDIIVNKALITNMCLIFCVKCMCLISIIIMYTALILDTRHIDII